jgi:hypothetical protein
MNGSKAEGSQMEPEGEREAWAWRRSYAGRPRRSLPHPLDAERLLRTPLAEICEFIVDRLHSEWPSRNLSTTLRH